MATQRRKRINKLMQSIGYQRNEYDYKYKFFMQLADDDTSKVIKHLELESQMYQGNMFILSQLELFGSALSTGGKNIDW